MLEIKPIEEKSRQEELCGLAGTPYRPEALAYAAVVNKKPVGICQFAIHGDTGYLYDLEQIGEKEDIEALFIMGRAVMSFMETAGAAYADFSEPGTTPNMKQVIGFRPDAQGVFRLPLKAMFEHHCKG